MSMLDCLCPVVGYVVSIGLIPWLVWCMCPSVGFVHLVSMDAFARLWAGLWLGLLCPVMSLVLGGCLDCWPVRGAWFGLSFPCPGCGLYYN